MGTQNFFSLVTRRKKISLFISLVGSKSNHLSYSIFLPCGYFPDMSKGLCIRCFIEKKPNFLLLEGDVSKEILVLRGWESITG